MALQLQSVHATLTLDQVAWLDKRAQEVALDRSSYLRQVLREAMAQAKSNKQNQVSEVSANG